MVSVMPTWMLFFVTPCRMSEFGLPPSIIHSTRLPSGSFTSTWNQEWGLIISHLTSVPFSVSGLLMSNSDELAPAPPPAGSPRRPPRPHSSFACTPPSSSFRGLLRGGFGSPLLLGPRAGERVPDTVVAFVAGVLEDRPNGLRHRRFRRPRRRPRGGIVDRESIPEGAGVHAREAFDDAHVLARPPEWILAVQIRRLDDEGIALPMTAGIAHPLAHVLRQRRPAVERNDAGVVDHLDENHHVSRALDDLVIGVVARGH